MDFLVYLFSLAPPREFQYLIPSLIMTGLFIVLGLIIKIYCKQNKAFRKLFRDSGGNFISIGVIGFILIAARDQGIPFIAMRALLAVTLFTGIYLAIKTVIRYFKEYPAIAAHYATKNNVSKKKVYSHSKKKK